MIKRAYEIMSDNFIVVDALDSIKSIEDKVIEKGLDVFLVREDNKLVGILTYKNIIKAHPNRIAADAMSTIFKIIPIDTPIWRIKRIYEKYNLEVVLVANDEKQIVGFITNTIINEEIARYIDSLTGLYKSEYIYYHGARFINSSKEISVLFIDINNFGLINKIYGHVNGDNIIKEIGILIKTNIPNEAFLCRFGGDEFAIVVPCHTDECENIANKLLGIISARLFTNKISVSVSVGIAGGRRYNKRCSDALSTISNLINIASLESTKAKSVSTLLSVTEISDISQIA